MSFASRELLYSPEVGRAELFFFVQQKKVCLNEPDKNRIFVIYPMLLMLKRSTVTGNYGYNEMRFRRMRLCFCVCYTGSVL